MHFVSSIYPHLKRLLKGIRVICLTQWNGIVSQWYQLGLVSTNQHRSPDELWFEAHDLTFTCLKSTWNETSITGRLDSKPIRWTPVITVWAAEHLIRYLLAVGCVKSTTDGLSVQWTPHSVCYLFQVLLLYWGGMKRGMPLRVRDT